MIRASHVQLLEVGEVCETRNFRKMKTSKEKEKISMEKYIEFFLSHKQLDLKLDFLNQIIAMHGFKRIYNAPKSVLRDAVKRLDVMNPSRSTLKENISPCAFITLKHITVDLNDLSWQDYCLTYINSLNKSAEISSQPLSSSASASASSYFGFERSRSGREMKWLTKRKRSSTST